MSASGDHRALGISDRLAKAGGAVPGAGEIAEGLLYPVVPHNFGC